MEVTLDVSPAAQGRGGIGRYCARLAEALAVRDDVRLTLLWHGQGTDHLSPTLRGLPTLHVPLSSKPWRAGIAAAHLLDLPLDRFLLAAQSRTKTSSTGGLPSKLGPAPLLTADACARSSLAEPGHRSLARVFHATDHLLPPLRGVPSVFTVHDLAFLTHPETHRRSNQAFLARFMPRFCRAATVVIADSESTRQDLLHHYHLPPDKVRTVHLGVERGFRPMEAARARAAVRERFELPTPYLLFVGTLEPRKNLRRLLVAYHALLRGRPTEERPRLAIAGAPGWWYAGLYQLVRQLGLEAQVRFLGRVDDADLPALYNAAAAFVYPSLYEGFGLPPLEALACGAVVVASSRSSLPEVVGDAALQVDPLDIAALASALARALDDEALRVELRGRARAQARRFTWERAATATVHAYGSALARWSSHEQSLSDR